MKRILGIVKGYEDDGHAKRAQISLVGLTDDVKVDNLPWAFPLDDQCIVPPLDSKVWVYVSAYTSDNPDFEDNEDYDYSNMYYTRFTEVTYKECYDYTNSDAYKIKDTNKITDQEPDLIDEVTYPENRVIKHSGTTVEFDKTNKRVCVTDPNGNYVQMGEDGVIVKSIKDLFLLAKSNLKVYCEEDLNYLDGYGNEILVDLDGVQVTDTNTNVIGMSASGIDLTDKNGNTVEMGVASVKINGTNLEILQ